MSKSSIRIGVLALTDSAPLVVASRLGLFEKYSLHVQLHHQPSWATLRDKLVYGQLDMAQMLSPMAIALERGLGGMQPKPLTDLLVLSRGGNGITVSMAFKSLMDGLEPGHTLGSVIRSSVASGGQTPVVGTVFPFSMHTLLLKRWLRQQDVDPDRDVAFQSVPPLRMVEALKAGTLDLFCVGEPWNTVAEQDGVGVTVASSQTLWPQAPEKVLGCLSAWSQTNQDAYNAVRSAIGSACAWLEGGVENRAQAAKWLSQTDYVNLPESYLLRALVVDSASVAQPGMVFDGSALDERDPTWVAITNETLALVGR